MGLLEILKTSPIHKVRIPNELFLRLLASYEMVEDGFGTVDADVVEELSAAVAISLKRPKSRLIVYDSNVVLVDNREVQGLTPLHKDILEFISKSSTPVHIDTLACKVWKDADVSHKTIQATMYNINRALVPHKCSLVLSRKCYTIKFSIPTNFQ